MLYKHDLDDKRCWDMWFELGTLRKVQEKLKDEGMTSLRTGRPFTFQAIYTAAWRWAREYPELAKDQFEKSCLEQGNPFSLVDFNTMLVRAVRNITWSDARFQAWLEQYDLVEYAQELSENQKLGNYGRRRRNGTAGS